MHIGKKSRSNKFLTVFTLMTFIFLAPQPAKSDTTILSFQANGKAFLNSKYSKEFQAMPEWQAFRNAIVEKIDSEINENFTRKELAEDLPQHVVDQIWGEKEIKFSTAKIIDAFAQSFETVFFKIQAKIDPDMPASDQEEALVKILSEVINGKVDDWNRNFDGLLAFITDKNPRVAINILSLFLEEGHHYTLLQNEPGGDFVIQFTMPVNDEKIVFHCAGIKLQGENRYALLFSNNGIARHVEDFKNGKFTSLDTTTPMLRFTVAEDCFRFAQQMRSIQTNTDLGMIFLSKIKSMSVGLHETEGQMQFDLIYEMRSAEDALALSQLHQGILSMLILSQSEDSLALDMLRLVKVQTNDCQASVHMNMDDPMVWNIIKLQLTLLTEEVKENLRD